MKLAVIAKDIRAAARSLVGGINLQLELGMRVAKASGHLSVNLEAFVDVDDTDLHDTIRAWERLYVKLDAELDFYCYARSAVGAESELVDNLGVLVRRGKIAGFRLTGDGYDDTGAPLWRQPRAPYARR